MGQAPVSSRTYEGRSSALTFSHPTHAVGCGLRRSSLTSGLGGKRRTAWSLGVQQGVLEAGQILVSHEIRIG